MVVVDQVSIHVLMEIPAVAAPVNAVIPWNHLRYMTVTGIVMAELLIFATLWQMAGVKSAHLQEQMCALKQLLTAVKKILVMIVQLLVMKKVRSMTGLIVAVITAALMILCFMIQAAEMQDSLPVTAAGVMSVQILLSVTMRIVQVQVKYLNLPRLMIVMKMYTHVQI